MAHGYIGDDWGIDGGYDRDRDRSRRDRDRDRGLFSGRERGWSDDDRWSDQDYRREQALGDFRESRRSFSAHPDDHYRTWRDRHMSELDRDYEDYCREREQAFHQDFDAWRRQRHGNSGPLRTGMTQSGLSHDPSGELQLTSEASLDQGEADPMDAATLGTNSSEGSRTRRGRR
jgi:hypothetical protein